MRDRPIASLNVRCGVLQPLSFKPTPPISCASDVHIYVPVCLVNTIMNCCHRTLASRTTYSKTMEWFLDTVTFFRFVVV